MTTSPSQPQMPPIRSQPSLPPLENGDRLISHEFERRYQQMPHVKKAELIKGIVYIKTSVRFDLHAEPHADLVGWLGNYKVATSKVRLGNNSTVRLDFDNQSQPDAILLIDASAGGQTFIGEDGYIEGAPELAVEVSASSATIDLSDKKRAYRRNGIREYLVWQVFDRRIDWFSLQNGDYVSLLPDETGVIRSQVFPGLWLQVNAMLENNMPQVLSILQAGLNSEDHRLFTANLLRDR